MSDEELALSIERAAKRAGIGRTLMYQLLRSGEGPPTVRLRRRRVIRVEALRRWLSDREARGPRSDERG